MSAGEMVQLKGLNAEIRGCAARVVQSLLWKRKKDAQPLKTTGERNVSTVMNQSN